MPADLHALSAKLQALTPLALEWTDDSHLHAGHAGAREGGHYRLKLVSSRFAGLRAVARHRLIYDALGPLAPLGVHALQIEAKAPDEV
jgi:BolA family transcriptional regulator, general stress-responsive regulator